MKKFYLLFLLLLPIIVQQAHTQILRPMTPRYSNASVKGNIVYVANNIITSAGAPTNEPAPGGTTINNSYVGTNIDIDSPSPTPYITAGDTWKHLVTPVQAAAGWQNAGFNDAAWPQGTAELGYGDGDEATVIGFGGASANRFITTYFRRTVNIANPSSHGFFQFDVKRDDGFVLYLNGVEISRNNMPAGVITWSTPASTQVDDAVITITVPNTAFATGDNTIAVEVHQSAANSNDLSFNLSLYGMPGTSLLPFGAGWKYLDNNTRPPGWQTMAYNDAVWAAGNACLGFGDFHINTSINGGPDPNNRYITTYFRKTINIPNPAAYARIIGKLRRDDGAVVYINGIEVIRSNMPGGIIAHNTLAAGSVTGVSETMDNVYTINPAVFVSGDNIIAVEIHQDKNNSSDLSFDFSLEGSQDLTFNSSSARLSLPSCSKVLFAGLYWGATQGKDGSNTDWITDEKKIKLLLPGTSAYLDIVSSQTDYHNGTLVPRFNHTGYQCFADITSLINLSNANGTYQVANVCGPVGILNAAGGWTIVIAYSDPSATVRNLTVFDGSVVISVGDSALHIPITGFLTPPSGQVTCELGAVVYDGDRGSQDEFSFKQNSNPLTGIYTNMTPNATANFNDMWNGTISYLGSAVTTRNPAHLNTLGYDADIINIPNAGNSILENNQSSASIRFSSPAENYILQVATTAISQYTPVFVLNKTATDLNGGSLLPGDSIRYQLSSHNSGNDASTATTIIDNIPAGTSYTPNSLMINNVTKTDVPGDDEAEYDFVNNRVIFRIGTGATATTGGEVLPNDTAGVQFKVYTASSCAALACSSAISNRAKISYGGKMSLINLEDSSGVDISGCSSPLPVVNIITGSCKPLGDTTLINICQVPSISLPIARYGGYKFYSAIPFIPANLYNPIRPVSNSRIIYAFYDGPGSCNDTARINIFITSCPDIDDDNDGLPDYVEINNSAALNDDDRDGLLNWNDLTYTGFIDNNRDGFNDNFDPGADSDNDGTPNFNDSNFPGWVDSNGDGVNDKMDNDLDGIPNHLDLDSDNDSIPDTVESFGVDANGDGIIDNYSDTDADGLSQNVDAGNTGVTGSGKGLGPVDLDADGIPNYLDLDSDNDGIPDITEIYGTDKTNSAMVIIFIDGDGDGFADMMDADVGNDGIAENPAGAVLKTGPDNDGNGRCDNWPNKNIDRDLRPNPYDLDSDGDGINDITEARFTDINGDGRIDGPVNLTGRSPALAALAVLVFFNTDGTGRINVYDIDSDDDGIPDNVEGQTTPGYFLPSGTDADGDGIDDVYDNSIGLFGGKGIAPVDTDSDTIPDYLDADTDSDGLIDRIEGNDLNLNGKQDDIVTLTGFDTDGDGLDNRFDKNNNNADATSAYMGNRGSTAGSPAPGSITTVQHTVVAFGCLTERDWRCLPFVLSCEFITFKASLQNQRVQLEWTALCRQEVSHFIVERSTDGNNFSTAFITPGKDILNEIESYTGTDDISSVPSSPLLYYRLQSVMKSGRILLSTIISIKRIEVAVTGIKISPNPVQDHIQLQVNASQDGTADITITDMAGRIIYRFSKKLQKGSNPITFSQVANLPEGIYYLRMQVDGIAVSEKFNKL
jgi:uncharacterized repeat protein (TIGR01451 family)